MTRSIVPILCVVLVLGLATGCARIRPPRGVQPVVREMEVTGYCSCRSCTNWRRNWLLRPVIAGGPQAGQRKRVGITASGTRARPGTLAADTSRYPFGTVMHIPGYGYGRVEDRGSAIQGDRLDLYFRSHREALQWGRQTVPVRIWPSR